MKPTFLAKIFLLFISFSFLLGASNNPTINIEATKNVSEDSANVSLKITTTECPDKKEIVVNWQTNTGSATANSDYTHSSSVVTFVAGSCTSIYTIIIPIIDDAAVESDETFEVKITVSANSAQSFTEGTVTSTVTITDNDSSSVADEAVPTDDPTPVNASCGVFEDALQTRNDPSKISHEPGANAYLYDSPDCTLNTSDVDFGQWQKLNCDGGDATATGQYASSLSINYTNTPDSATLSSTPSSSTTNQTVTSSQTLSGTEYSLVEIGSGNTGSLNVDFSALQKINNLDFTINNSVTFSTPEPYNLEIGNVGIVNNGEGNSLTTSTTPKNIKIDTFLLPGGTTVDFEAYQTIKMESMTIGRISTNITLKAQYVQLNSLNQSDGGYGSSSVTIIADYVDIGTITLGQEAKIYFKPYTAGKRILFRANSIAASSSSSMIVDSGNYYTGSFNIPATSNSSSIAASDSSQIINFYINGDFNPGNNPGINSSGNNGNYGTLPPENFLLFVNGDLGEGGGGAGGGGTTFNATVYVEGSANLGAPTYIKGALSSGGDITIGDRSKFYYDQGISDGGWGECSSTGIPTYDNEYSCGIFPSVLASYQSIETEQNDIFDTCVISVKDYSLTDDDLTCYQGSDNSTPECSCDDSDGVTHCSTNDTCTIVPEPTNKYSHDFIDTTEPLTPVESLAGNINFNDIGKIYYPSYTIAKQGNNKTVHFDPQETYQNSSKKIQVFGNVSFTSSGQEIIFEEGDYYFNSLNMGNTPDLTINGDVRFFVKNDFTYSGNSMDTSGDGNLFVYIGGDLNFTSNGGGNGFLAMFLYVLGDANIAANANAAELFGGITAEGSIYVDGNNMNFRYNEEGAEAMGYGECKLCYALASDGSFINFADMASFGFSNPRDTAIVNNSDITLSNVNVIQAESSSSMMSASVSNYSVVDNNGNDLGTSVDLDCFGFGGFCMGDIELKADFGDYPAGDINNYNALRTEGMSGTMFGVSNFKVFSEFDDGDKHYNVELDYCDVSGYVSDEPVLGQFDAFDTTIVDRNITTKVANRPFSLRIVSYDDSGVESTIDGVDAQYRLYDYNTSAALSLWTNFNSSTSSSITDTFTVTTAHRDVRVQFQFCQSESNSSLMPLSDCQNNVTGVDYNISPSSDNFAIRPDRFVLSPEATSDIELLTSAKDYNLSLIAAQDNTISAPTQDYNISNAQTTLDVNQTIYNPDNTDGTATLNGTLSLSSSNYDIVDGTASNGIGINFTDVGKVNVNIRDITWAAVDINVDTTPVDCSEDGAYICGDINATFIPANFSITDINVTNVNGPGTNFTYLDSNETNDMSAKIALNIEAQNAVGATTQNFDIDSWENPVNIDLNVTTTTTPILVKKIINDDVNLSFEDGSLSIPWDETNTTKQMNFNFQRAVNIVKNPFRIIGTNVDVNASSTYTSSSGNVANVTGTNTANVDTNATFIYGRTNAPRRIFNGNSGNTFIYFESYCFGVDSFGVNCNRTILPNGNDSNSTNDPRWFVNSLHTVNDGIVGDISQKNASNIDDVINPAFGAPTLATMIYNENAGYPYKATMENNASEWLIYNQYNPIATTNEFEVEFQKSSADWAGVDNSDSTTDSNASSKTNRRIMW